MGLARAQIKNKKSTVRKADEALRGHAARIDRSRRTVLDASAALMLERGPAAFSIDAVVERTGVAKTTIYRHWPSRSELMAEVFKHLMTPGPIPDTGTLRGDLIDYFLGGQHALDNQGFNRQLQTLPGIIEASRADPDLAAAGAMVLGNTLQSLIPMLERGRARGEVRADRNLEAISHLLLGGMFVHRAIAGSSDDDVVAVIDSVLEGIMPIRTAAPAKGALKKAPARKRSR